MQESNDSPSKDESLATSTGRNSPPISASTKLQGEHQRRQKRNRQQALKRPCTCGRIQGWHSVGSSKRPSTKTIRDERGNPIEVSIKRKYTPPDDPGPSEAYWALNDLIVTIGTVQEMLPLVAERYPSLLIRIADYAKAFEIITKVDQPRGDERFSKTWISWWLICLDVKDHGYNAAASKNAIEVRSPNGKIKRTKLTPEYIRDKFHVAHELAEDLSTYMRAYLEFREVWTCIVNNDKVIREEFLRRLERNEKNMVTQRDSTTSPTDDCKPRGGDSSDDYTYSYNYIEHYDSELYKHDKRTQGKVRCGPFTDSEIRTFF